MGSDRLVVDVMDAGMFELELGLIQTQMAQKPMPSKYTCGASQRLRAETS
jgi:hypothetical protein